MKEIDSQDKFIFSVVNLGDDLYGSAAVYFSVFPISIVYLGNTKTDSLWIILTLFSHLFGSICLQQTLFVKHVVVFWLKNCIKQVYFFLEGLLYKLFLIKGMWTSFIPHSKHLYDGVLLVAIP